MRRVADPTDIWVVSPTTEDLMTGAKYAEITLPWTFNRMMKNTSSRGQQERALNIAKGGVVQEVLRRELTNRGIVAPTQQKSHRDDDLFDFRLNMGGSEVRLDVKSIHHYSNYDEIVDREPLTPELIIEHSAYSGPDWRRFFPVMVPHTQINQNKQAYCFAIASSVDPRGLIDGSQDQHVLAAFPYGDSLPFLSSGRLCRARENAGNGIFLDVTYNSDAMFDTSGIEFTVVGEWAGQITKKTVVLKRNQVVKEIGPFSVIGSFQIDRTSHDQLYGQIEICVGRNDFDEVIPDSQRRNMNVVPDTPLILTQEDFCNLLLPVDYRLFFLGWITKEEFLQKCRNYTGWVWPKDSVNPDENQAWEQITENDKKALTNAGFGDAIQKKPSHVNAGWLKTSGKGQGACCYVFPNSRGGGVKETNLYVLVRDLIVMDELGI